MRAQDTNFEGLGGVSRAGITSHIGATGLIFYLPSNMLAVA